MNMWRLTVCEGSAGAGETSEARHIIIVLILSFYLRMQQDTALDQSDLFVLLRRAAKGKQWKLLQQLNNSSEAATNVLLHSYATIKNQLEVTMKICH